MVPFVKIPALLTAALSMPALAHHSSAAFDFRTQIAFAGIIETIELDNPHIAMTLATIDAGGRKTLVNFIEGVPAAMLARSGLRPEMVKPGTHIVAIGSPRVDDRSKYFLRIIRLDDGSEF